MSRSLISGPYFHLLKSRLLEFKREPSIIFWVFGLPIALALVLGVAFREKPANSSNIALVGRNAEQFANAISVSPIGGSTRTTICAYGDARSGFQTGNYDLVVQIKGEDVQYLYDASRPESV